MPTADKSDFSYFEYPSQGVFIPNGIPFFPHFYGEGSERLVAFNQGYVIDYNAKSNASGLRKIEVQNCAEYVAAPSRKFFVKIQCAASSSAVESAEIYSIGAGQEVDVPDNFHYSAVGLDGESAYLGGVGIFYIPLCETDSLGGIKNLNIRENIHWQKINFQTVGEGVGVLHNWGESAEAFGNSPNVKFRTIKAEDPLEIELEGETIVVKMAGSSGSGSNDPYPPSSKTAIVPFEEEYIGFVCTESPEAWFIDIVDIDVPNKEASKKLSEEFVSSCEKDSINVISVCGIDKETKAHASIKNGHLHVKKKGLFNKTKKIRVFLYGVRKFHKGKYKRYTEDQYLSNEAFYASAHSGNPTKTYSSRF